MHPSESLITPRSVARRIGGIYDSLTRGWAVTVAGSALRMAIGLITSILLARALGPAAFGVYILLAGLANIAGVLADVGLTASAVRAMAADWADRQEAAWEHGRALLWLRVGGAVLVVGVGALLSAPLAAALGISSRPALLLALLGLVPLALSGSVAGMLQATGHFSRLSLVSVANAALTALLAIALYSVGALTLTSALLILGIGTTIVSFLIGRRLLPQAWPLRYPGSQALAVEGRRLLETGRWLWIANLLAVLAAHLDVLLVNRWSAPAIVGFYSLALNLASKVEIANYSLYTVLQPASAALKSRDSYRRYLRHSIARGVLITLPVLALIPLAPQIVALLYGGGYAPAAALLRGLLCVVIVDIFATPLSLLLYGLNRPRQLAAVDTLRIVTLILCAAWLIPLYGPQGAIFAKLASRLAGAALALALLQRRPPDLEAGPAL